MKENKSGLNNNIVTRGYKFILFCLAVVGIFVVSCKQNNSTKTKGKDNKIVEPAKSEVAIMVDADEGAVVDEKPVFTVKKGETWQAIKDLAEKKITLKQNKQIKEWRRDNATGEVLEETKVFNENAVVYVVTEDKTQLPAKFFLTIEVDEGYSFKDTNKPCTIEIDRGTKWQDCKTSATEKIELKPEYEVTGWKLGSKDGGYLQDSFVFETASTVYATSKKKDAPQTPKVTITVAGDDGFTIASENTFEVDKQSLWNAIKAQAIAKVTEKEDFQLKEWHMKSATGVLLNNNTKFEEDETVFAVSKRKVVVYKVEHCQENADDDGYTTVEKDTEDKTGEAGRDTDAKAKQYEGFEDANVVQTKIKADGSTVVQIKYARKKVNLILNLNGGKTTTNLDDGENGKKLLKGKVGSLVKLEKPTKQGQLFVKWEPALPERFPLSNGTTEYVATWKEQGDLVQITIAGDERLNIKEPVIEVALEDSTTFASIKQQVNEKVEFKDDWKGGYEIYDYRVDGEEGVEITDATPIKGSIKVYVRTNYKNFEFDEEYLTGYDENIPPRGRIFIPKQTTGIGKEAFYKCDVESVNILGCKELKYINKKAFSKSSVLKTVHISDCAKLESIEKEAFPKCTALETVKISNCPAFKYIGKENFAYCEALKNVDLSEYGGTDLEIGEYAFAYCEEAQIVLPSTLKRVGKGCFGFRGKKGTSKYCKSVVVPKGNTRVYELVKNTGYPEDRIRYSD